MNVPSKLSSAVTQGAEVYVIDALKNTGNETWFIVLERSNLTNPKRTTTDPQYCRNI